MINRFMFKGYYNSKDIKYLKNDDVKQVSVHTYGDMVFLYFETLKDYVDPKTVVECDLKEYPNGDVWERMAEIFHYCEAISPEQWARKEENKKPWVRVNSLKYDKISSYIFYHYQYQEEDPAGGDKYGIIFLSGNLMIFYCETPTEYADPKPEGKVLPKVIPDWGALMDQHFGDELTGRKWVNIEQL